MTEQGDFFQRLNRDISPKRPDLIEKDYHLHRFLRAVSQDEYLSKNLVFKATPLQ